MDMANIFEGFKEEDLSVAHTNKRMWKIEENVKIQEEIRNLAVIIKTWKEEREREVGGDNVKKISSDIIEMKKKKMEKERKTKN